MISNIISNRYRSNYYLWHAHPPPHKWWRSSRFHIFHNWIHVWVRIRLLNWVCIWLIHQLTIFLCRQFYWWTCITGEKSRLEEWNLRLEFQKVYQTSDFHGLNLILIEKQRVLKAIGISDLILQSKQKFRWISMRLKMIRYYLYLNCQSQITVKFLGLDSFKPSLSPSLQRWRSTRCSSSPSGQLPVISKSLDVRVS